MEGKVYRDLALYLSFVVLVETMYYAHKPENRFHSHPRFNDRDLWDSVADHARAVAQQGRCLIDDLDKEWLLPYKPVVSLFGYTHDFGKLKEHFAIKLDTGKEPFEYASAHTPAGVRFVSELFGHKHPLTVLVSAHHGGLSNYDKIHTLISRSKKIDDLEAMKAEFYAAFPEVTELIEEVRKVTFPTSRLELEFLLRILFSICTFADTRETREYSKRIANILNGREYKDIQIARLDRARFLRLKKTIRKMGRDGKSGVDKQIIRYRNKWYSEAMRVARTDKKHCMFSLDLPTGGAKTLIGLAFAYSLALRTGCKRIVYVAPYLSILDQNTKVYAESLGLDLSVNYSTILEHHSHGSIGRKLQKRIDDGKVDIEENIKFATMMEAEWRQPIVVTTALQILESLFTRRAARSHKILNLADSVVFFDEFQTLPADLREDTADMLSRMSEKMNMKVIFGSATNTPWQSRYGSCDIRPIVKLGSSTIKCFRRVKTKWVKQISLVNLADRICKNKQAMCIVNTRRGAQDLAYLCAARRPGEVYCLETLQHKVHRLDILEHCRQLLESGKPVLLISTQTVEAGVDISFPKAYRQIAPLESIIQAAGRCNRHGELGILGGILTIFDIEPADGNDYQLHEEFYTFGGNAVRQLLENNCFDIYERRVLDQYFNEVDQRLHKSRIVRDQQAGSRFELTLSKARESLRFDLIEKGYVLIDHQTKQVLIFRNDAERAEVEKAIATIKDRNAKEIDKEHARRTFNDYQITLYDHQVEALAEGGYLTDPFSGDELAEMLGVYVCSSEIYDPLVGVPCIYLGKQDKI